MRRAGVALMAAVLFTAGCGMTVAAQAQGTISGEAQRRECERNGGYWSSAASYCRIGA